MKRISILLLFCGYLACGYCQAVVKSAFKAVAGKVVTDALMNNDLSRSRHGVVSGMNSAYKGTASLLQPNPQNSKIPYADKTKNLQLKELQKRWEMEMDSLRKIEKRMARLDSVAGYTRICGDWIATIKNGTFENNEYYRIAVKFTLFSVRVKKTVLNKEREDCDSLKRFECRGMWMGHDSLSWSVSNGYNYIDKKVPSRWGEKLSTYSQQIDNYEAVLVDSVLKCTRKTEILYYDDYGALLWNEEKTPIRFTCRRMKNENGQNIERW